MKNFSKFASLSIVAGILLTGCSSSEKETFDAGQVRTEAKASFIEIQKKSAESSKSVLDSVADINVKVNTSLDAVQLNEMHSSSSLQGGYEKLSSENQKKIAEIYIEADPISEFYNYEGMSDSEKAVAGVLSLLITSMTDENDAKASESLEDADITIRDAEHVEITYEDPDQNETSTSRTVFMMKDDNGWKIDGVKTVADYNEAELRNS